MQPSDAPVGRWVRGFPAVTGDTWCRYCGRFGRDCAPVACLLCGTVQCHGNGGGNGRCGCCYVGYLPGWSHGNATTCARARVGARGVCGARAVGVAARRPVCLACAAVAKHRDGQFNGTLAAYAQARIAERDAPTPNTHQSMRWRYVTHTAA